MEYLQCCQKVISQSETRPQNLQRKCNKQSKTFKALPNAFSHSIVAISKVFRRLPPHQLQKHIGQTKRRW